MLALLGWCAPGLRSEVYSEYWFLSLADTDESAKTPEGRLCTCFEFRESTLGDRTLTLPSQSRHEKALSFVSHGLLFLWLLLTLSSCSCARVLARATGVHTAPLG